MTNEEAIKIIKVLEKRYITFYNEERQALIMAIKVLEQELCDDCISRQAVLDINEHHHGQMPNHVNHEIWNEINALPSVTPKKKTAKWIFKNDNIAIPTGYYQCSKCKEGKLLNKDNFCPNCGLRMIESQESENKE